VALLLVVLPLTLGRGEKWPVWTWICLAASEPAVVLFVAVERRKARDSSEPLVNLDALARAPVFFGLVTLFATTGTYYAFLFTVAQYLQDGLGRSVLFSGLILVPWVAAFGIAGQIVRRLPARLVRWAPASGCLLLGAAYAVLAIGLLVGDTGDIGLVLLLTAGGLGLGIQFSAMVAHLTNAVPTEYAADISGVTTTTLQIGGGLGIALFATLYFAMGPQGGVQSSHAFAITVFAMAIVAVVAAISGYASTRNRSHTPAAAGA
jgi:hypothetical protein